MTRKIFERSKLFENKVFTHKLDKIEAKDSDFGWFPLK